MHVCDTTFTASVCAECHARASASEHVVSAGFISHPLSSLTSQRDPWAEPAFPSPLTLLVLSVSSREGGGGCFKRLSRVARRLTVATRPVAIC